MQQKTSFSVPDSPEVAAANAKKAQSFLSQHTIPPTPINYSVAYEYSSGRNESLQKEIDRQLERGNSLDSYFLNEIFTGYFLQQNSGALESQVTDINEILFETLKKLSNASDDFTGFEKLLETQADKLEHTTGSESLHGIVESILQATHQTLNKSSSLREHLDESNSEIKRLQKEMEALRKEATMDPLTGLYNRKALAERLDSLLNAEVETPLSVLMMDIDHFKRFNDTYGHLIGDEVIRRVAATIKKHTGEGKVAARFGGEEFTLVLPDTALDVAMNIAELIHKAVSQLVLVRRKTQEKLPRITISVGAVSMQAGEDRDDLLERADQALYMAKNNGRNQIVNERQMAAAIA
jgi:diguanylate cyclase